MTLQVSVFPRETNSNGVHNPRRNGRNTTSVSMDAGLWTRMAIWTILQRKNIPMRCGTSSTKKARYANNKQHTKCNNTWQKRNSTQKKSSSRKCKTASMVGWIMSTTIQRNGKKIINTIAKAVAKPSTITVQPSSWNSSKHNWRKQWKMVMPNHSKKYVNQKKHKPTFVGSAT